MGSVVPESVSQCRSELGAPCRGTKGIGYALLMLLVLQLGVTVSKRKGEKCMKSEQKHCNRGVCVTEVCIFLHVDRRDSKRNIKADYCTQKKILSS